jgi:hypothetical protein
MVGRSSLLFPTKDVMKGYYSIEMKHGKTALLNHHRGVQFMPKHQTGHKALPTSALTEPIGISIIIFNLSTYFGMNPFISQFFS